MQAFIEADRPLSKKWVDLFNVGLNRYHEQGYDQPWDQIIHRMNARDAKAFRNLAHRAARHYVNMYGGDDENTERLDDARESMEFPDCDLAS